MPRGWVHLPKPTVEIHEAGDHPRGGGARSHVHDHQGPFTRAAFDSRKSCEDHNGEVAATYLAKELLREFYAARRPAWARSRLRKFYAHCDRSGVRECKRLARTIREWEAEILAFHATGDSNGPTEGINLLIKKIKRVGHGFRNFTNYRLRLLLHCGGVKWQTHRTARVRGRQPRFAA